MVTQEYLKEHFFYQEETGLFFRKQKKPNSQEIGKPYTKDNGSGYIKFCVCGSLRYAHRMAWLYVYGEIPEKNIDHINGNRSDNRIANLRLVNQSENTANSRKSKANTSGRKGVTWRKDINKWSAQIMVNYKHVSLGVYDDLEEAANAYKQAAQRYFGEYANV